MSSIMPFLTLLGLFVAGLLVVGVLDQTGGSMKEKAGLVFEVYRYTVCFLMVVMFGVTAYTVIAGLVAGNTDPAGMGAAGAGVLLSVVLYFLHWNMKNPNAEA